MTRRLVFTIYHGLVASLALHSALALPVVLHGLVPVPEQPATLIVELKGIVADSQTAEQAAGDTEKDAKPVEAAPMQQMQAAVPPQPPPPEEPPQKEKPPEETPLEKEAPEVVAKDEIAVPVPPEPAPPQQAAAPASPVMPQVAGAEQQRAQTIRNEREAELSRLRAYVKLLTKKVQANLVYPDEGRRAGLHGVATVSFTILGDGGIRPETLAIVKSSGQRALDMSALRTIRASIPFDPPPKEITVSIDVAFGRKS